MALKHSFAVATLISILSSFGAIANGVPATKPAACDLTGTWLVETYSNLDAGALIRSKLTISGNSFALVGLGGRDESWTGTFALGTQGNVPAIDLHSDKFDWSPILSYAPGTAPGIYGFRHAADGDHLTICFATEGETRPTQFHGDKSVYCATLLRVPNFKVFPDSVKITVLDPQGNAAPNAKVFDYVERDYLVIKVEGNQAILDRKSPLTWRYSDIATTGADGTAVIPFSKFDDQGVVANGAHDEARDYCGFAEVSPALLRHGILTIRMQPRRTVHVAVTSSALTRAGKSLPETYAYVISFSNRIMWRWSDSGKMDFPLPPGRYDIYAYGDALDAVTQPVTVPTGAGDFALPSIDLKPARILFLMGEAPPPLHDVIGWKNGAFDFPSLRGKVVLLDFWGYWCGPCVAEMPTLIHLYDKFKDKGLAIVTVHVDSGGEIDSVAKLDEKLKKISVNYWKGRDLPFPTALISGKNRHEEGNTAHDFGVESYPTTIFIDRHGMIIGSSNYQAPADIRGDETKLDADMGKLLAAK